jgi:hypothetical protein
MNNQVLLIYDCEKLYEILNELQNNFSFKVEQVSKNDLKKIISNNSSDNLIFSKNEIPLIKNQISIEEFPIKISKLIEKFNIEFLKLRFDEQSEIVIGRYYINLNSREMKLDQKILKLTEKECEMIIHLSKLKKPESINSLQKNVWGHQHLLETHTVETHIYRLRKKISKVFKDDNFIVSKKDGYKIN